MFEPQSPLLGEGKSYGHSIGGLSMSNLLEQRFWDKVVKSELCWLWSGARNPKGYGRFYANGKFHNAHRFALILSGIVVPNNSQACHHCDNPPCVRPSHLFVGTKSENMKDAIRKGRVVVPHPSGEDHWKHKLARKP
jgi:hypothetical protein